MVAICPLSFLPKNLVDQHSSLAKYNTIEKDNTIEIIIYLLFLDQVFLYLAQECILGENSFPNCILAYNETSPVLFKYHFPHIHINLGISEIKKIGRAHV